MHVKAGMYFVKLINSKKQFKKLMLNVGNFLRPILSPSIKAGFIRKSIKNLFDNRN